MQFLNPSKFHHVFKKLNIVNEIINVRSKSTRKVTLPDSPVKPKRPPNAYLRYLHEMKPILASKYPDCSPREIMDKAIEDWNNSNDETKAPYMEAYKRAVTDYLEEVRQFEGGLTDVQKEAMELKQKLREEEKNRRKLRKVLSELGKPKSPGNLFSIYMSSKKSSKYPNESGKAWFLRVTSEWKNLSNEEKQVFVNESKKRHEAYAKELVEWKKKVIDKFGSLENIPNSINNKSQKVISKKDDKPN